LRHIYFQVGRPAVGVSPRDWADKFPSDTFINSLLNAVLIHTSGQADGAADGSLCAQHGNRIKEFYCMTCKEAICAHCIVKKHKGPRCDCVSTDEALERARPRIDSVRHHLQLQLDGARRLQRGEADVRLSANKDRVLTEINDLETKLNYYFQTALQQLDDMRATVREAGSGMNNDAHVAALITNINETIRKFDENNNDDAGVNILHVLPTFEGQIKEYDNAIRTVVGSPPDIDVHFMINKHTERIFENLPNLGSVVIKRNDEPSYRRGQYNQYQRQSAGMADHRRLVPRLSLDSSYDSSPRATIATMATMAAGLPSTGRPESVTSRTSRSDISHDQGRPKVTVSAKMANPANQSWQLTGIAIVQESLIITDAYNSQVYRIDTNPNGVRPSRLSIDCPVCVAPGHGVGDAMVTQPEFKKLTLLETTDEMIVKDTFETVKPYEGIANLPESRYAVSCCVVGGQCVDIIDEQATVLQTIDKDETGNSLFSWPRFLSSNNMGEILVSDRDKRAVMCVTSEGEVRWTFETTGSPWGVSWHASGSVYLCLDSNEVHVLNGDGALVERGFVGRRDSVAVPYAISTSAHFLAITEWGSNIFSPSSPYVHMFAI